MARQRMSSTRKKAKVTGKRKGTRRRRARVGAVDSFSGIATKLAGLGVGAIGSRAIINIIAKMFPTMTPTIAASLQIALGIFTPKLVKSSFGGDIGDGAAAAGFMDLVVSMGIISGTNGPNDRMSYHVNPVMNGNFNVVAGTRQRAINGSANFDVVTGMPIPSVNRAPRQSASNLMAARYVK